MQKQVQFDRQRLDLFKKIECFNRYTKIRIMKDRLTQKKYIQKSIQINQQLNQKYAVLEHLFMRQLKSEFIVQLVDSFQKKLQNNSQILVLYMQFCQNGDLDQYLRNNKVNLNKRIQIFFQILIGLKDLHKKYIMHRDLKLSNIFVTKQGKIKIGDLGVITQASRGVAISCVGTFGYQAPQIFLKEENQYSDKVDVWSLGFLAFQLLSDQYQNGDFRDPFLPLFKVRKVLSSLNFEEKNIQYKKILQKPLIFDKNLPDFLKNLIRRMLNSNSTLRISFKQMYQGDIFKNAQIQQSKYLTQIKTFGQIYQEIELKKQNLMKKNNEYVNLKDEYFSVLKAILLEKRQINEIIKFYKFLYLVSKKMRAIFDFFTQQFVLDLLKQFCQVNEDVQIQYQISKRKLDVYFHQRNQSLSEQNIQLNNQAYFQELKDHFTKKYR